MSLYAFYEQYFPFWKALKEEDKNYLCENTAEEHFDKEQPVHNNMGCSGLFIVRSGRLRLYMLSEDGKEITLRRSYFETYLFSHFVKRGAKALATSSYRSDLTAAAFRNPDGKIIVVVSNSSDTNIQYNLSVFNRLYKVMIAPQSMVTYEIEE